MYNDKAKLEKSICIYNVFRNAFGGSHWSSSIIYLMLIRENYKFAELLGISKAKHKK